MSFHHTLCTDPAHFGVVTQVRLEETDASPAEPAGKGLVDDAAHRRRHRRSIACRELTIRAACREARLHQFERFHHPRAAELHQDVGAVEERRRAPATDQRPSRAAVDGDDSAVWTCSGSAGRAGRLGGSWALEGVLLRGAAVRVAVRWRRAVPCGGDVLPCGAMR